MSARRPDPGRRRGDQLPRSVPARGARLSGRIAREGARHLGTGIANVGRSHEQAQTAKRIAHEQTAASFAQTLGELKAGSVKLAQLLSFIDLGVIPAAYRELYERELGRLRDAAPPMSMAIVRDVLAREWGTSSENRLADLSSVARAASLGQVHQGVLPDGRRVAIKMQYPDVADAYAGDIRLGTRLMAAAFRAVWPAFDSTPIIEATRDLIEELDYMLESSRQREFAVAYRGHPFIHVPDVIPELSGPRVLVTEWVDGLRFDEIRALPQEERDRFGEILARFYFGAIRHVGSYNADPHPGNFLLMADGRVAFLDFGIAKQMPTEQWSALAVATNAWVAGDWPALRDAGIKLGVLPADTTVGGDAIARVMEGMFGWLLHDHESTIDADVARRFVAACHQHSAHGTFPRNEVFLGRLDVGLTSVLAKLNARANWHRIMREILFKEPPSTSLGHAETEFFTAPGNKSGHPG